MSTCPLLSDTIVLIIEPNSAIQSPYTFISELYDIRRVSTIEFAIQEIYMKPPDIVFLSASFPPHRLVVLLDELKNVSVFQIIPLVIVVDLSSRISTVLGLTWGDKIAIVDSRIPPDDFFAAIRRVNQ
jgi:DNA-binding response OmpR family regulator